MDKEEMFDEQLENLNEKIPKMEFMVEYYDDIGLIDIAEELDNIRADMTKLVGDISTNPNLAYGFGMIRMDRIMHRIDELKKKQKEL